MIKKQSTQGKSGLWKFVGALALLALGGGFLFAQYQKVRPPTEAPGGTVQVAGAGRSADAPAPPPGMAFEDGPPGPEERRQMREQVFSQLDLSSDQRAQIDAIVKETEGAEGFDGMRQRMERIREVLTPEQEAKAREQMQGHFQARLAERLKVLPPGEQEKFIQKMQERRSRFESGMAPRGGGFGPPPPPEGEAP